MSASTALRDLLVTGGVQRVYVMGAVPDAPTYPYAVVGYAPAAPQVRDLAGGGDVERRFTVQVFGRTAAAVESVAAAVFAAFDGRPLPFPDEPVCWQEMATPLYRDPDSQGVLNVLHAYRF